MKSIKPEADRLLKAYEDAKLTGDKDLIKKTGKEYGQFLREKTYMNERYKSMLDITTTKLANVNEIALSYLNDEMPSVYVTNYNQLSKDMPAGISFDIVDETTVKNLIKDNPKLLPTKKLDIPKDKRWNQKAINAQVLQGIIQGESIDKTAKRLTPIMGRNKKAAIRNARTMTTSAQNKGRLDSYKTAQDKGVVLHKVWMATRSDRTRAWHTALNGVEAEIDQPFENDYGKIMFPGDPNADPGNVYNCRCTLTTKIIGFRRADGSIKYIEGEEPASEVKTKAKSKAKPKTEVKTEARNLKQLYKDNVQGLSKSDVIKKFISKDSYVNDPDYKKAFDLRNINLKEQSNVIDKIHDLESKLSTLEAIPKPKSEWTADDMMKSLLGKKPMIQSDESKKLEKEIDDLWKKHSGLTGIISKADDDIERLDKKNYIEQIKNWTSADPKVSTNTHFEGFSTTMRISQFDDDLANGIGYIAEMSPTEYLERCAYDIFDTTYESTVLGAETNSILKYAKQMSQGVEFDMGYLDYGSKKQEGRHRAMAAELLGIKKIPVYIRGR